MASDAGTDSPAVYQHPLAYLLGLEGIALLRAFAGEHDREFTLARLREIARLIKEPDAFGAGVGATPVSSRELYDDWAPFYDKPGNQLLELEEPVVCGILAGLPVGIATDADRGTGRH